MLFTSDWEYCVCWCRHGNHCRIPTRVAGFLQKPHSVIASFLLLDAASRDKCQSSLFFFSSLLLNSGNDSAIQEREHAGKQETRWSTHLRAHRSFQPCVKDSAELERDICIYYSTTTLLLWSLLLNFTVQLSNMTNYITKIFLLQLKRKIKCTLSHFSTLIFAATTLLGLFWPAASDAKVGWCLQTLEKGGWIMDIIESVCPVKIKTSRCVTLLLSIYYNIVP